MRDENPLALEPNLLCHVVVVQRTWSLLSLVHVQVERVLDVGGVQNVGFDEQVCDGRVVAHKDLHLLSPGACRYGEYHGNDLADLHGPRGVVNDFNLESARVVAVNSQVVVSIDCDVLVRDCADVDPHDAALL